MVNLFFGDLWSILSSITLLIILIFTTLSIISNRKIELWGRRTLVLTIIGLALCCFAVMRDDYVTALQGGEGFFALDSLQVNLSYAGGAINLIAGISSVFVKNQKYRRIMFFVLSASIIFKILIIEISRIALLQG